MSLHALAKKVLGITLDKSWKIQCSNWEDEKLSPQQIEYAMNDALVASHIFLRLEQEKAKQRTDLDDYYLDKESLSNFRDACSEDEDTTQLSPITSKCQPDNNGTDVTLKQSGENLEFCLTGHPTSQFADSKNFNQGMVNDAVKGLNNGVDYHETIVELGKFESDGKGYFSKDEALNLISLAGYTERAASLCKGVIDVTFNGRKRNVSWNHQDGNYFGPKKSCKPPKNGTRESPLYVKCMLTDPHGSKLCSLDRKKADWYIAKGKGKVC